MKFYKQQSPGVFVIDAEPHNDLRGSLRRHFCKKEFEDHGLNPVVAQTNISTNLKKHTLRGFHYQIPPFAETKTVSCLLGSIYFVIVDLRPQSPTFKKSFNFELSAENQKSLQIPPGCAAAFLTLEDNSLIHYYMSEFYAAESYRGFRYNDPVFNVKFPAVPKVISDKDLNYPDFDVKEFDQFKKF